MIKRRSSIGLFARGLGEIQHCVYRDSDFSGVAGGDVWEKRASVYVAFPQEGDGDGREVVDNHEMVPRHFEQAECRYPGFEITTAMRIRARGKTYQILSATNIEGRNRWVDLKLVNVDE